MPSPDRMPRARREKVIRDHMESGNARDVAATILRRLGQMPEAA